jgi:hypothetical protein
MRILVEEGVEVLVDVVAMRLELSDDSGYLGSKFVSLHTVSFRGQRE